MLNISRTSAKRIIGSSAKTQHVFRLYTSNIGSSVEPNAPLDLDPSLRALLKDADMSLQTFTRKSSKGPNIDGIRELEVIESDDSWDSEQLFQKDEQPYERTERKSARAAFGSKRIGSVFIPDQMKNSIERIINDSDKPRLHEDAKRLFGEEGESGNMVWDTIYHTEYKSKKQAARHAERDSTALASVALPAHYSVVYAVLDSLKHRLGDELQLKHVIEWGSNVGPGLWAAMNVFRDEDNSSDTLNSEETLLSQTTLASFLGIEKRRGLTKMAERIIDGISSGPASIKWVKGLGEGFPSSEGHTLALNAFQLSSLPNGVARKELVKQMWDSGASVIVLIDHDTSDGFQNIAEARQMLLRLGRKQATDPLLADQEKVGCHVVAPCPHDGICPLFQGAVSKLKCTFSQRLQRPAFMRKTKHLKVGHEDIGYSYVIIRRGERPMLKKPEGLAKDIPKEEPLLDNEDIRKEAYAWPRLIFPPLKRSGHVILDGCTSEGEITRMTIPRSQGKQPYYDARKSSWGDIFPHRPKNAPQIRISTGTYNAKLL